MRNRSDLSAEVLIFVRPSGSSIFNLNAEGNSLSVIDLSGQQVKETISFGEASGRHGGMHMTDIVMWPHHIYLSPDGTKLGVGVPGMDLSAGHAGDEPQRGILARWLRSLDLTDGRSRESLVYDANTMTLKNTITDYAAYRPTRKELWVSQAGTGTKVAIFEDG